MRFATSQWNGLRFLGALCALFVAFVGAPARPQPLVGADEREQNKDVVEEFFALANGGRSEALASIVREDYVEHADMPDRLRGLAATVASNRDHALTGDVGDERQRIRGDIVRMIAERDHVWTFAEACGPEACVARIDMFRLADGQIAEHWAVVEQVAAERVNDNDNFAAGRGPQDRSEQPTRIRARVDEGVLERNREAARLFYHYFEAFDDEALRTIMAEDYIQHNAGLADGREPLLKAVAAWRAEAGAERRRRAEQGLPPERPEGNNEIIRIVTEGDLVWAFIRRPDGTSAQFNQFRVEHGVLVEHWGVYQDVPTERQTGNSFFGFGRGPASDFSR